MSLSLDEFLRQIGVRKMLKILTRSLSKIRLAGISSLKKKRNHLKTEPVPKKFKKLPYIINWTFVRLEINRGCESYFYTGCNPENYWGGPFPQK